jgi:DNA-binding transcriptional ArsR family regulator
MSANENAVESREVGRFDRVVLRVYNMVNQVQITQGERASLTIEARSEILSKIKTAVRGGALVIWQDGSWLDKLASALTTSLTRPTVRYHLTVTDLACLELAGFVHAYAAELHADSLSLKLKGAGQVVIGSLTANSLAVDLEGAGRIELAGQVQEQRVAIQGPGFYEAYNLKSQRARVGLKGLGKASIWAVDSLEIKVRGLGHVDVRGTPVIRKDISPRAPLPGFGQP